MFRPAWAEVDLAALAANVRTLLAVVAPARLCAVVKADGYGHGSVAVARAALDAGARSLAVAMVEEGVVLRERGITAPVLVLAEPTADAMEEVVARRLTPTLYTTGAVEALAKAAASAAPSGSIPVPVHVKVDTGMHRLGVELEDALRVAAAAAGSPHLRLEGLWTHFAVADELANPFTAEQRSRFDYARRRFAEAGLPVPVIHAANSAAAVGHPQARYDMVRCGISLYGYAGGSDVEGMVALKPVLSVKARVIHVRTLAAGEALSYGQQYRLPVDSVVATVPLGYADGVARRLSTTGAYVLVGGRRRPIAGTVTMDHILLDCGPGADVTPGDEVVLLGEQGAERVTADDWARRLDTISYEVLCGIGPRVPRVYVPSHGEATPGG